MSELVELKEAVIVEGVHDKNRIKTFICSPVISTGGFRIFKDKEKQILIRKLADRRGILILTDSDSAGFVIRKFIEGIVDKEKILHAYAPMILGKEKRKSSPSKEGLLGVEGIEKEELIKAIKKSGATIKGENNEKSGPDIDKTDLYELGLSGGQDSKSKREKLLKSLSLPFYLSANELLCALNCFFTKDEFYSYYRAHSYDD